jgi:hypothetical protein
MKRIKDFNTYINEAETKTKDKDFAHLPKLKLVVDKEFFAELKEHIFYWFTYDFLKEKYILDSLEKTEKEVVAWFYDNLDVPLYQYKVYYTPIENMPLVEKIEQVKMNISIYEYENQTLLKQTEMMVGIKYLNSESFNKFVNKVKKRIIRTPKNGEDIEDFKRKEKRRLSDNIT